MANERDRELCTIALDEAFKLCGNPEATFQQTAVIMGMNKIDIEAVTPLAQNYSRIVSIRPTRDPGSGQRWVLARAWELATHDHMSVMDAFEAAWVELAEISQPKPLPVVPPVYVPQGVSSVGTYTMNDDDDDMDEFPAN